MPHQEREELLRGKYPFPSAVRRETAVPIYTSNKENLPSHIIHRLHQGHQVFGGPAYYEESIDRVRGGGRERAALQSYETITTDAAEDFIHDWYGLDRSEAHLVMGNRGSYGILMDTFFNVVKAPSQGIVRVLDIGMDFPAAYKASQRYDTLPPPGNESPKLPKKIPYYSVVTEVESTLDKTVEEAIKTVDSFGKRSMEGFVVILSDPNSPKGDSIKDEKQLEELIALCAKYGYLFIGDEAFKAILKPEDSMAKLIKKYPNMLVTGSLSKVIGFPGAGVGWGLMSPELADSWEGTRMEMDMRAPETQVAFAVLNPEYKTQFMDHIKYVTGETERINNYFIPRLEAGGLTVFKSDSKVPIFFVKGRGEYFCDMLEDRGVKVARGSGFKNTFRSPRRDSPFDLYRADMEREDLTDQYARVTTPGSIEQAEELIPIFTQPIQHPVVAFY